MAIRDLFSVGNTLELCPVGALQETQGKPLLTEWWENVCSVLSTDPDLKELDLGNSILNKWAMKTGPRAEESVLQYREADL